MILSSFPGQSLAVETLRDGGFVVFEGSVDIGRIHKPVFACTGLDALLDYMRARFEPPPAPKSPNLVGESA